MVCSAGAPKVFNCAFRKNRGQNVAGGVYVLDNSNPTFELCRFTMNSALGQTGGSAGGAVYVRNSSGAVINSCEFFGNSALGSSALGGAVYLTINSNITLSSCVFSGNTSQTRGGAVYASSLSSGQLSNCTFSGNTAADTGAGGVHLSNARMSLTNCILWGNSNSNGVVEGAQIGKTSGAIAYVNYSCVHGLTGALGGLKNFGVNPLFVDSNGADNIVGTEDDELHLQLASPCARGSTRAGPECRCSSPLIVERVFSRIRFRPTRALLPPRNGEIAVGADRHRTRSIVVRSLLPVSIKRYFRQLGSSAGAARPEIAGSELA